jgi:ATP synthase protein I
MSDTPEKDQSGAKATAKAETKSETKSGLAERIGAKARRKLRAQRNTTPGVWFGLGMMGLIGWSVVAPTLLGAALGLWLDKRYPVPHSWTLALLVVGLVLGCFNAWRWVEEEHQAMHDDLGDTDNTDTADVPKKRNKGDEGNTND